MSWSFNFKGRRERVIEAVKAYQPSFTMPQEETDQLEAARAVVLCNAEQNTAAEALNVHANGSWYKDSTTGKSTAYVTISVQSEQGILF